jgi:hypothetical protein
VLLLYRDYKQSESARHLGLEKHKMERAMRSIRQKLADWRPDTQADLNNARRYSTERAESLNSGAA